MPEVPLPPPGGDLTAERRWAVAVMRSFGLGFWGFGYNRRVRSMGLCRHFRKTIELSIHLIERNPSEEVLDTLLHEIAHGLVGPKHGHDAVWRAKAREVGCKPERCGQAEMPEGRWRAECGGCGVRYHRHRRPKRMTGWFCRPCGPERGSLTWVEGR